MLRTRLLRWWLRGSALLPLPVAHAVGVVLGEGIHLFARGTRRVIAENITACFPDASPTDRADLIRRSCRELGKQIMETGIIWYASPARLRRLVVNPAIVSEMESLWPEGRGMLVAVPHLGNWELCNLFMNLHHPVHHLYRPPRAAWMEPILVALRERAGGRSMPTDVRGLRYLLRCLREGRLVGILPDQIPDSGGVHAPFFGRPALTMTLFGQMARKTGAGVALYFSERLPFGRGFRLHVLAGESGIADPDPLVAATALNQAIEACVLRAPAQYQWSYRRFRNQPDGENSPYRRKRPRKRKARKGAGTETD